MIDDKNYLWLNREAGPRILREAISLYGVKEIKGTRHSKDIMAWSREIGGWIAGWYDKDEIPWCGLFVGICAKRAGFPFGQKMLSAREWLNWGQKIADADAMLGDVLVFGRKGGGHVGFYVGEDATAYHVLGGNQSDMVCITRILKHRLLGVRRCEWRIAQPANVRKVYLKPEGAISHDER